MRHGFVEDFDGSDVGRGHLSLGDEVLLRRRTTGNGHLPTGFLDTVRHRGYDSDSTIAFIKRKNVDGNVQRVRTANAGTTNLTHISPLEIQA